MYSTGVGRGRGEGKGAKEGTKLEGRGEKMVSKAGAKLVELGEKMVSKDGVFTLQFTILFIVISFSLNEFTAKLFALLSQTGESTGGGSNKLEC